MNLIIAQGEREIVRIKKFLDLPKKIITDHNKEFIIKLLKKKFKEYKRKEIFEERRKIRQNNDDLFDNIEQIRRIDKINKLSQMIINEKYIFPSKRFSLKDLDTSF